MWITEVAVLNSSNIAVIKIVWGLPNSAGPRVLVLPAPGSWVLPAGGPVFAGSGWVRCDNTERLWWDTIEDLAAGLPTGRHPGTVASAYAHTCTPAPDLCIYAQRRHGSKEYGCMGLGGGGRWREAVCSADRDRWGAGGSGGARRAERWQERLRAAKTRQLANDAEPEVGAPAHLPGWGSKLFQLFTHYHLKTFAWTVFVCNMQLYPFSGPCKYFTSSKSNESESCDKKKTPSTDKGSDFRGNMYQTVIPRSPHQRTKHALKGKKIKWLFDHVWLLSSLLGSDSEM